MTEEIKQENKEVNKGGRPKETFNCGKCNKPKSACECGRPTVMTLDVITKLEDAFAFCFTDQEACFYAGISTMTLWRYEKENPEFSERKKQLRLTPNIATKKELVSGIKGNIGQARWWAQNKMGDEFGEKTTIKHEGSLEVGTEELNQGVDKAVQAFNDAMRVVLTKKKVPKKDENKDRKTSHLG